MSLFAEGQIWRRIDAPIDLYTVYRVDRDEHDIAVCHAASCPPNEVHPFDVVLISATERDLARWEVARWEQVTP